MLLVQGHVLVEIRIGLAQRRDDLRLVVLPLLFPRQSVPGPIVRTRLRLALEELLRDEHVIASQVILAAADQLHVRRAAHLDPAAGRLLALSRVRRPVEIQRRGGVRGGVKLDPRLHRGLKVHSLHRADPLLEPLRHFRGKYRVPVVFAPPSRREEPLDPDDDHGAPRLLLLLLGRNVAELVAYAPDDGAILAKQAWPIVPILGVEP
mmetsp:Transcript_11709/g.49117  ORF Transcript_11709/g.49117 Transcript_11709/m.49117 type:complete len:207 (-) Transcript_11709:26-646(-)